MLTDMEVHTVGFYPQVPVNMSVEIWYTHVLPGLKRWECKMVVST